MKFVNYPLNVPSMQELLLVPVPAIFVKKLNTNGNVILLELLHNISSQSFKFTTRSICIFACCNILPQQIQTQELKLNQFYAQ